MSTSLKGNAVVGQSGGPTGVINQSLVGVIEEVCEQECIDELLGAIHGVRGIVNEQFANLKKISRRSLDDIARTPSAALGSTRDKPDEQYCHRIFEVFRQKNVRYFFYIGGNDSANTAHIVNGLAQQAGYDLKVFQVDRAPFLHDFIFKTEAKTVQAYAGGKLVGFAVARPCFEGYKIGPFFADDIEIATKLAESLFADLPGKTVFIEVPEPNVQAVKLVNDFGMSPGFPTARMYTSDKHRQDVRYVYGITSRVTG